MFHSKHTHVHPKPDSEPLHSPLVPSMSIWSQEQKVLLRRWSIGTMLLALLVIGSVLALLLPSVHAIGTTNPHQDCHVKVHLVQWPGFINPVTETVSENGHQVQLGVALLFSDTCQMNFAEATIGAPPDNTYVADVSIERAVGPDGGDVREDNPFRVSTAPIPFDSPYIYSPFSADAACLSLTPSNAPMLCTNFV